MVKKLNIIVELPPNSPDELEVVIKVTGDSVTVESSNQTEIEDKPVIEKGIDPDFQNQSY